MSSGGTRSTLCAAVQDSPSGGVEERWVWPVEDCCPRAVLLRFMIHCDDQKGAATPSVTAQHADVVTAMSETGRRGLRPFEPI